MQKPYSMNIKRNDTGPPVLGKLISKLTGDAVDLDSVTITFIMYKVEDDGTMTELVNAAAVVDSPTTNGTFQYNWQVGDTEEAGTHLAAFELIFTGDGNRKETYPSGGWINIEIEPDLEDA